VGAGSFVLLHNRTAYRCRLRRETEKQGSGNCETPHTVEQTLYTLKGSQGNHRCENECDPSI
jgi:hypothetical protein